MTRALVVSRFFPFNAERVGGAYQRLGTQVEALASVADCVDCLFLVPPNQNFEPDVIRDHEQRLRRLWSSQVTVRLAPTVDLAPPKARWRRIVPGIFDFRAQLAGRPTSTAATVGAISAAIDARPDIVLVQRLESMYPLMTVAGQSPEKIRRVLVFFDMDDIDHVAMRRRLLRDPGGRLDRLMLLQLPALMLAEIRAVRLAVATFVCSEADRRYLARLAYPANVQTVPNSVIFPTLDDTSMSEPLVLFVGGMGHKPNAQAAKSLVREIWPRVRTQVPAARLAIIGPGSHTALYPWVDESVTFPGFVEDLQPWYRRARVVCCPIYHGAGTRVKIIEAAAHAKAIVSTRLGAEGLDFEDEREIILRDDPAAIAAACVHLLTDADAAPRLGRAALQKARRTYDRGVVVQRLAHIFRAARAESVNHGFPA
jgi:glycosyltransferase involved in cell wall biosynthesis